MEYFWIMTLTAPVAVGITSEVTGRGVFTTQSRTMKEIFDEILEYMISQNPANANANVIYFMATPNQLP